MGNGAQHPPMAMPLGPFDCLLARRACSLTGSCLQLDISAATTPDQPHCPFYMAGFCPRWVFSSAFQTAAAAFPAETAAAAFPAGMAVGSLAMLTVAAVYRGSSCPLYHGTTLSQDDLGAALAAVAMLGDPDLQLALALQGERIWR